MRFQVYFTSKISSEFQYLERNQKSVEIIDENQGKYHCGFKRRKLTKLGKSYELFCGKARIYFLGRFNLPHQSSSDFNNFKRTSIFYRDDSNVLWTTLTENGNAGLIRKFIGINNGLSSREKKLKANQTEIVSMCSSFFVVGKVLIKQKLLGVQLKTILVTFNKNKTSWSSSTEK